MGIKTHLFLIAAALATCGSALADQARDDLWRADLSTLASQLPAKRLNFSSSVSPAVFNDAVANLGDAIPNLTDGEIVTGMARIVALLNDPHTNLTLPQSFPMRRVPLKLAWFDDGLFVTGAAADYAKAVGTRVVEIGNKTTTDAMNAVAPVISHENDAWVRYLSPSYLGNGDILEARQVASDATSIRYLFEDLSGSRFAMDLPASTAPAAISTKAPDAATGFTPLYRQNQSQYYWFNWLQGTRTLYFKYNVCANMANLPFTQFSAQLLTVLDSNPVQVFVVDLRGNTGGDSSVMDPLLAGIAQRSSRLRSSGISLAVFIDEGTISSGLLNAESLLALGFAVTYGSPTGGTPNHYGNIQSFVLPYSKLQVNYSTSFFKSSFQTDSLEPDFAAPIRSADYFARHDPVMAAVTAHPPPRLAGSTVAVVNSTSFRAGYPVAPGSIASAFGDFTGTIAADATTVPLPKSLGGVQVLIGGIAAPLFGVRTSQINFQVPASVAAGIADIAVMLNGGEIAKDSVLIAATAPGIFVVSPTDISRPGAVLNADSSLNGALNRARRGDVMQIYATGQGAVSPSLDDGAPGQTIVLFGVEPAEVLYSGLSPALPGVWQMNVRVPEAAPVAGQMPVTVYLGGAVSDAVTVWVEP